jgi:hypothetical protein
MQPILRELLQTPHHFTSGTTDYVTPSSHNQFCQESLPYITAATALLTTIATTFYQLLHSINYYILSTTTFYQLLPL